MISLFLLLPLYCISIQYERGGWWRVFYAIALPTLFIDIILNYCEWSLYLKEFPKWGEFTLSTRLKRLRDAPDNEYQNKFARYLSPILDIIAPSGKHI